MRCYLCGVDTDRMLVQSRAPICEGCQQLEVPYAAWVGTLVDYDGPPLIIAAQQADATIQVNRAEWDRFLRELSGKKVEVEAVPQPVAQRQPVHDTRGNIVGYTIPLVGGDFVTSGALRWVVP